MWCRRQRLITQVYVLYPAEYYPALTTQFSATVVVGWLKRAIMRKILYGLIRKHIRFCCMTMKNGGKTTTPKNGTPPWIVYKIGKP